MQLTINGQKIQTALNEQTIAQALQEQSPQQKLRVMCQGSGQIVMAQGRRDKGFRLVWQDNQGDFYYALPANVDEGTVLAVMTLFVLEEVDWQTAVTWQSAQDRYRRWNLPVGLLAFVIFVVPYTLIMLWTMNQDLPGKPTWSEVLLGFVTIAVIAGTMQYVDLFFRRIRPWLAALLESLLGVTVREDMANRRWLGGAGPGTWEASGGSGGNRALLYLLDLFILLGGLIGPIAVVSLGLFLLFD